MNVGTHVEGNLVMIICTLREEVVTFGGTLAWLGDEFPPLSTWMLALGVLDITHQAMSSPWRRMRFDGDNAWTLGGEFWYTWYDGCPLEA